MQGALWIAKSFAERARKEQKPSQTPHTRSRINNTAHEHLLSQTIPLPTQTAGLAKLGAKALSLCANASSSASCTLGAANTGTLLISP